MGTQIHKAIMWISKYLWNKSSIFNIAISEDRDTYSGVEFYILDNCHIFAFVFCGGAICNIRTLTILTNPSNCPIQWPMFLLYIEIKLDLFWHSLSYRRLPYNHNKERLLIPNETWVLLLALAPPLPTCHHHHRLGQLCVLNVLT